MGTRIEQTDLARDALYTKVNQMYDEKVGLTGNETIGGKKSFSNDVDIKKNSPAIFLRENDVVKGTNPQSEQGWSIYCQDSSNASGGTSRLGFFSTRLGTTGTVITVMSAYKNEASSDAYASIRVYYPQSGSPYATCPTPTDTTSVGSTQIATVGWVNTVGNNVVHKTGDETIGGNKTFLNAACVRNGIYVQHTDDNRQTAPSQSNYAGFTIEDVNGERLAIFEKTHRTNGDIVASMYVSRQGTTGTANQIGISVIYPSSGNGYATCPTPTDTTSTSSVQIDTVGARNTQINNKFKVVSSLPSSPDSNTFYFVTG